MIVVDTVSQSITPGNDRDDGSIYTNSMQRVVGATGANVTALHHPTKDGNAFRGDSAFQGNVDTLILVDRDAKGRGSIKAGSKFRIGDPAKVDFAYRLKAFKIDEDEDGDPITVVLSVPANTTEAMGAVDDTDDDDAMLTPTDTPKDKMRGVLNALTTCINRSAATTGDAPSEVGVSASLVFAQLNVDRIAAGLDELKDRTAVPKFLAKLEADGKVIKAGTNNRLTEYRGRAAQSAPIPHLRLRVTTERRCASTTTGPHHGGRRRGQYAKGVWSCRVGGCAWSVSGAAFDSGRSFDSRRRSGVRAFSRDGARPLRGGQKRPRSDCANDCASRPPCTILHNHLHSRFAQSRTILCTVVSERFQALSRTVQNRARLCNLKFP